MRGYVFSTGKQLVAAGVVAATALWMGVCTAAMMVSEAWPTMVAQQFGKVVFVGMLALASVSSFLVSSATSFPQLMFYAFLVGIGGNSFSVGSAWNAA